MSFLNPFSGLRHLDKVPRFLSDLASDLQYLFSKDLSPTFRKPPREWFTDDARYSAAIASLARERQFAVLRQAVRKQMIRRTLWWRFGICYLLLGPLVIFFWIGVFLLHLAAIAERPEILDLPLGPMTITTIGTAVVARILLKA